jgi:antitoxin VapB
MALNIKNGEVERLAGEVATMAGESKTEAVRQALLERRDRLAFRVSDRARADRIRRYLEEEVWPNVLPEYIGRGLTDSERDENLGYGPGGV